MKCLINTRTGAVVRVSEERATELYKKGPWEFTPKQTWKDHPDTTWKKSSISANPMSEKKRFRKEKRNR